MKQSNKILIVLAVLFFGAYLANVVFHIVNLKKAEKEFSKNLSKEGVEFVYKNKEDRLNAWTDRVRVVCLNSNDKFLFLKLRVEGKISYINIMNKDQKRDFYKNILFKKDTLIITEKAAYVLNKYDDGLEEYYIGLPNVKSYYWNGKLVKRF